jgi:hypothetical protein
MSKRQAERLELYYSDAAPEAPGIVLALLYAPKVVIVSQYADLRDEQDKLIATITWTSPIAARRL